MVDCMSSGQAQNIQNVESGGIPQDTPEELIRLQCQYYRSANALLSLATAQHLGSRLANIAQGSFMPTSGFADVATLAGLLNLDQRSVFEQAAKADRRTFGFGRTVFYSLALWFTAPRKQK